VTDNERVGPLEHYSVESYVREEMDAHRWLIEDLAVQSGLDGERLAQFLNLGMWGDDLPPALEQAFGISAQTWETLWLSDLGWELNRLSDSATIDARDAELRLLRAVRVAASRHECDMWDMDAALEAYETEHLGWPKWDGAK